MNSFKINSNKLIKQEELKKNKIYFQPLIEGIFPQSTFHLKIKNCTGTNFKY